MDLAGERADSASARARSAPLALGRYRLGPRLGSGAFGVVHAAHDERLDREVAVKVIPAAHPGDVVDPRAHREALAAGRLSHPAVVAVFDAGEDAHARYLVSELVHGRTLDRLFADGQVSDRDVLRVGLALADALEHAHERGVVHRDVKPSNVIVPDDPGQARAAAKLADFGVAHLAGDEPLTRTGDVVGTLAYMAPEQASGHHAGPQADLYALALVLYEGLAGANPVRARGAAETARRLGSRLPPLHTRRPELPDELTAAIDAAVLPDPDDRGTLADLADALLGGLSDVSDEGGTIAAHPAEFVLPRPLVARLAGAALTGALAAWLATEVPAADIAPVTAGAGAAALTALAPRLGWVLATLAATVALANAGQEGRALLLVLCALPAPLLAPRGQAGWSLPVLAPVLASVNLAGCVPALAGSARSALSRAGLGALAGWWLVLAAPPLPTPAATVRVTWEAVGDRLTAGPALLVAFAFAAAALLAPWLVRGVGAVVDAAGAIVWSAGLAVVLAGLAPEAGVPGGIAAGGAALGGAMLWLGARARARR